MSFNLYLDFNCLFVISFTKKCAYIKRLGALKYLRILRVTHLIVFVYTVVVPVIV